MWLEGNAFLLSLSALVLPVFTTVTETTQDYICMHEFHQVECDYAINNSDCDQYWSAQDNSIGTFLNFVPECHSPCKELFAGKIVLEKCVNITLAVICSREDLTEYRVDFIAFMIPQPINERGRIGVALSLAMLLIASLILYVLDFYSKKPSSR